MRIYLLRHGPAAHPQEAASDADRPLTHQGRALVENAMRHHAGHLPPIDQIWCSPYLRARQTALLLAEALRNRGGQDAEAALHEPTQRDDLVPGAKPGAVLDAVQVEAWEPDRGALVLVGHEPHLGRLLGLLIAGAEPFGVPLQPGMLAGVELADPRTMVGRLVFCMAAEDAAPLAAAEPRG